MPLDIARDLKHSFRSLRRSPAPTLIVVGTLAIGFGVNGAIYSFTDAVLFRSLPYADSDRLVMAWATSPSRGSTRERVSYLDFLDWKQSPDLFDDAVAFSSRLVTLTGTGDPEMLQVYQASPGLFRMLGVEPAAGRPFSREEEEPGGRNNVVVMLHTLWERRFGADPAVVGSTILLQGEPFTVVGVMPAGFHFFNRECEIIAPLPLNLTRDPRDSRFMRVMARLRQGVPVEQARTRMDTVARRLEAEHAATNQGWRVALVPVVEETAGPIRTPVVLVTVAAIFVLLSALASVTTLVLSRSAARRTEIAVRMALGASRGRVFTQLLSESALLTAAAVLFSAPLLHGGSLGILELIPQRSSVSRFVVQLAAVGVDARVLTYVLIVSAAATLFLTVVGFRFVTGPRTADSLRETGRTGGIAASTRRVLSALVIVQISAAVALSTAAALLARNFVEASRQDPGFRADNVWTASISLPTVRYRSPQATIAFWRTAAEQIALLPGVTSVGAGHNVPLEGYYDSTDLTIEGRVTSAADKPRALDRIVTDDYFTAIGIPVREGRTFTGRDTADSVRVAIIDEELARRAWPGENPIGRRVQPAFENTNWYEIVGIVGAVREDGLSLPPKPTVYFAHSQMPRRLMSLIVRSTVDPDGLTRSIRHEIRVLDAELALHHVTTMANIVRDSVWSLSVTVAVVGALAVACFVLAAMGVYGIVGYVVARRTSELGVRIALGARSSQIRSLILRQVAYLSAAGVVCGLAGALVLLRLVSNLWSFELNASGSLIAVGSATLIFAVSLLSAYVPAVRATRIDPLLAMRTM